MGDPVSKPTSASVDTHLHRCPECKVEFSCEKWWHGTSEKPRQRIHLPVGFGLPPPRHRLCKSCETRLLVDAKAYVSGDVAILAQSLEVLYHVDTAELLAAFLHLRDWGRVHIEAQFKQIEERQAFFATVLQGFHDDRTRYKSIFEDLLRSLPFSGSRRCPTGQDRTRAVREYNALRKKGEPARAAYDSIVFYFAFLGVKAPFPSWQALNQAWIRYRKHSTLPTKPRKGCRS